MGSWVMGRRMRRNGGVVLQYLKQDACVYVSCVRCGEDDRLPLSAVLLLLIRWPLLFHSSSSVGDNSRTAARGRVVVKLQRFAGLVVLPAPPLVVLGGIVTAVTSFVHPLDSSGGPSPASSR